MAHRRPSPYRYSMVASAARLSTRALSIRAWRGSARGGPQPDHPPIQRVAADLRRLHRQLESLPPGASYVRSIGVAHAYDQMLSVACAQLEVPTRILELPDGKPRMLERIRLEFLLGESGLHI